MVNRQCWPGGAVHWIGSGVDFACGCTHSVRSVIVVVKGVVWRLQPVGVAWDWRISRVFSGRGCAAVLAGRLAQWIVSVDFKGGVFRR